MYWIYNPISSVPAFHTLFITITRKGPHFSAEVELNKTEAVPAVDEEADYHREGQRRKEDIHDSVGRQVQVLHVRRGDGDILRSRRRRLRRREPQGTHHRAGLPQGVQRLGRNIPSGPGLRPSGQDGQGEVHPEHDQGPGVEGGRDNHRDRLRQRRGADRHGDGPRGRCRPREGPQGEIQRPHERGGGERLRQPGRSRQEAC